MRLGNRERILVLNGSYQEAPLIRAAKSMDFEVVTTGLVPEGFGHTIADKYVPRDFSDATAILDLARDLEVTGVVSGCNDFAALTAAQVAQWMELPGHDVPETAFILHHKDRFRDLIMSLGLPAIRAKAVRSLAEARRAIESLGTPVLVKPIDLTGGKGISLCRHEKDLSSALHRAFSKTRSDHVVIEQFIDGDHHGFSCFIKGQKVLWWFADDEQYFLNPFLVAGTSVPASLSGSEVESLLSAVERIAASLSLTDGLLHVQAVRSVEGVSILEVCRRCPGDLYPEFVQLVTDWDYAKAVVQSELGKDIVLPPQFRQEDPFVRDCAMATRSGTFQGMEIAEEVRDRVIMTFPVLQPGSVVNDHMTQKCEILFLKFETLERMKRFLRDRNLLISALVTQEGEDLVS